MLPGQIGRSGIAFTSGVFDARESMIIFPAIDLFNGQGVRLTRGAFDTATLYEPDPIQAAERFAAAGARWLHVVDLNGARDGRPTQAELIGRIARHCGLRVQAGGGLRDLQAAHTLIEQGVERIVLGSLAVRQPAIARAILQGLGPERVVLAADMVWKGPADTQLLADGWQAAAGVETFSLIGEFVDAGLRYLLSTDVNQDGMLGGANLELYRELRRRFPTLSIIASGGVASLAELPPLRELGVSGVVVGKALYEGRFTLECALSC